MDVAPLHEAGDSADGPHANPDVLQPPPERAYDLSSGGGHGDDDFAHRAMLRQRERLLEPSQHRHAVHNHVLLGRVIIEKADELHSRDVTRRQLACDREAMPARSGDQHSARRVHLRYPVAVLGERPAAQAAHRYAEQQHEHHDQQQRRDGEIQHASGAHHQQRHQHEYARDTKGACLGQAGVTPHRAVAPDQRVGEHDQDPDEQDQRGGLGQPIRGESFADRYRRHHRAGSTHEVHCRFRAAAQRRPVERAIERARGAPHHPRRPTEPSSERVALEPERCHLTRDLIPVSGPRGGYAGPS